MRDRKGKSLMLAMICIGLVTANTNGAQPAPEWQPLFNGKSLQGWFGDPKFWSVEDDALTGATTTDNPTRGNTFLIYIGDNEDLSPVEFADFELKLKYRVTGHNSGIQYRSFVVKGERDDWRVGGYQADMDAANEMAGAIYGERFRRLLAGQGERSKVMDSEPKTLPKGRKVDWAVRTTEVLANREKLKKALKTAPEWNEMHIIARGHHSTVKINGVTMSELLDEDISNRRASGLIAIQLHRGPPMKVQVKDIWIRKLRSTRSTALSAFHRRIGHRCDLCLSPLP